MYGSALAAARRVGARVILVCFGEIIRLSTAHARETIFHASLSLMNLFYGCNPRISAREGTKMLNDAPAKMDFFELFDVSLN